MQRISQALPSQAVLVVVLLGGAGLAAQQLWQARSASVRADAILAVRLHKFGETTASRVGGWIEERGEPHRWRASAGLLGEAVVTLELGDERYRWRVVGAQVTPADPATTRLEAELQIRARASLP